METLKSTLFALSVATLSGAALAEKNTVYTDSDPEQNFEFYKSFSWASDTPGVIEGQYVIDDVVKTRIEVEIVTALEAKGYSYTDKIDDADFAVDYSIGARDNLNVSVHPAYFMKTYDEWTWGQQYYGSDDESATVYGGMEAEGYTALDGALGIVIYDVKAAKPVWYAEAVREFTGEELDESARKAVTSAVDGIMRHFPPK